MEISVLDLTSVDKEITIKADRTDLNPKFDQAFKRYRTQINMPGFRPGKVPVGLIKKRFGKEIEAEEIQKYVDEVFRTKIVPEHSPIGETEFLEVSWEEGNLSARMKIGVKPEFELVDVETIEIDKLVHDVTSEEVDEELKRRLESKGTWEETEDAIVENSRIIADVIPLGEDGEPSDDDRDLNVELDLATDEHKETGAGVQGKKAGDTVDVNYEDGTSYRVVIRKVKALTAPTEISEELAKEFSNGEAEDAESLASFVKSQMQDYYDNAADDMMRNSLIKELVDKHQFDIPEVLLEQILNTYVQQLEQQQQGNLPDGFNLQDYKNNNRERAVTEARWVFISDKLQQNYDDIELKPEDVDAYFEKEAKRYGMPAESLKQIYGSSGDALERLRNQIREGKLMTKLADVVKVNELSKDEFDEKQKQLQEAANAEAEQEPAAEAETEETE